MGEGDEGAAALMDRDGNAYSQVQPMRLLDSIDVHLARRADGSGHAVVEPGSGAVLVAGDDAGGTWDKARQIAAQLGRRRVQAAIDAVGPGSGGVKAASAPVAAASTALPGTSTTESAPDWSWRDLYDQAVRQGSDWETLHHDGRAPDHDAGLKRYQGLQDRLREALMDPATPDEAHLPLANAGYRLYTGANAAGLAEAKSIPYSAREAITGSVPFSGGGSVGPRVTAMPRGREVLPATVGNRTAVAVEGEVPNAAVKAPQVAGLETAAPAPGAGAVGLELPATATTRAAPSQAAAESPARGLSPPAAAEAPLQGGESASGLAGAEQPAHSASEVVRTPAASAHGEEVQQRAVAGAGGRGLSGSTENGTDEPGGQPQGTEPGGNAGEAQVSPKPALNPPLSKADFPEVGTKVSNKQLRHITDHPLWHELKGGHLPSQQHAQDVLDAYHSGEAAIIGRSHQGFPVVRLDRIAGFNNNKGANYVNQATNVFMIKGTKSPSVVPISPEWKPKQ